MKVERKVEGDKVENSRIASVEQPASSSQLVASTNSDPELLTEDGESIKNLRVSKSVVSSVVNFVIGKVDKRKDKLIEFEDNDEGIKVKSMNLILVNKYSIYKRVLNYRPILGVLSAFATFCDGIRYDFYFLLLNGLKRRSL